MMDTSVGNRGHLYRAFSRLLRKKLAIACLTTISIIYFLGIFAPLIAPYGYNEQDYQSIREAPTFQHIAGTDLKGRDVFFKGSLGDTKHGDNHYGHNPYGWFVDRGLIGINFWILWRSCRLNNNEDR